MEDVIIDDKCCTLVNLKLSLNLLTTLKLVIDHLFNVCKLVTANHTCKIWGHIIINK